MSQVQAHPGEAGLLGIATESWGEDRCGLLQIPMMEKQAFKGCLIKSHHRSDQNTCLGVS